MTEKTLTPEEAAAHLEAAYLTNDNHMRDLAQDLIRTGVVNDDTTIGDAKKLLDDYNAVAQR